MGLKKEIHYWIRKFFGCRGLEKSDLKSSVYSFMTKVQLLIVFVIIPPLSDRENLFRKKKSDLRDAGSKDFLVLIIEFDSIKRFVQKHGFPKFKTFYS
jgi:hypothetical protein